VGLRICGSKRLFVTGLCEILRRTNRNGQIGRLYNCYDIIFFAVLNEKDAIIYLMSFITECGNMLAQLIVNFHILK